MSPQSSLHPFLEERIGKDQKAEEESNQVDYKFRTTIGQLCSFAYKPITVTLSKMAANTSAVFVVTKKYLNATHQGYIIVTIEN